MLFIWNVALVVDIGVTAAEGDLVAGLAVTTSVFNIWDIKKSIYYDNFSSILQLIKIKS